MRSFWLLQGRDDSTQSLTVLGSRTISSVPIPNSTKSNYSKRQEHLDSKARTSSSFSKHFPNHYPETLKEMQDTMKQNGNNTIKTNPWLTTYPRTAACMDDNICPNEKIRATIDRSCSVDTSMILDRSASQAAQLKLHPATSTKCRNTLPRKPNHFSNRPQTHHLKIIRERSPLYMNARCESSCSLNTPHVIVGR